MSGYEDHNYPAFDKAVEHLRGQGCDVVSPHTHAVGVGWCYADYIREDLKMLLDCEAIYLLVGWEKSKGACLEKQVAETCGMSILFERGPNID